MKSLNFIKKIFSLMLLLMNAVSYGQTPMNTYKTMFVYNFIKHIQWPTQTDNINIGIIGNDQEMMMAFEKMAKAKSTADQQILIKKIEPKDVNSCHIVYALSETPSSLIADLASQIREKPVVLITDQENSVQKGATISFKMLDNKLRFQINKQAFDKNGLKVSGTLISMAI